MTRGTAAIMQRWKVGGSQKERSAVASLMSPSLAALLLEILNEGFKAGQTGEVKAEGRRPCNCMHQKLARQGGGEISTALVPISFFL